MSEIQKLRDDVNQYAADCHDAYTQTRGLAFQGRTVSFKSEDAAGGLFEGADVMESGRLNDWAAKQLVTKLDAPGYEWLFTESRCPADLETTILNTLTATRDDAKVFIRSKGEQIRAILSDQYTKFDNTALIDLTCTALETMGLQADVRRPEVGDDLSAYILIPGVTFNNDPRSKGGEGKLHPAIHISNSERGGGTAKIAGAVFTSVCSNGMILGWKTNEVMAVRHRYISTPAMGALVAEAIATGFNMSEHAAKAFVQAQEIHIPKPSLQPLVSGWADKYGLSVGEKENWLGMIAGEINRNERPEDPRLFDVINAATEIAQQKAPVEAILIERMAGDMLFNQFPYRREE